MSNWRTIQRWLGGPRFFPHTTLEEAKKGLWNGGRGRVARHERRPWVNGVIVGAALGAAVVGVFTHDWSARMTQPPVSQAAVFLEKTCGYLPSAARKKQDLLADVDFGSIAAVSAIMDNNSNIKLGDELYDLKAFWLDHLGKSEGDLWLHHDMDEFNAKETKFARHVWAIAERAAKCGAALGLAASGR